MIYVIGHKNPDTDSVVSALLMAEYLSKTTESAKAVSFGKISKEAKFILKKAGVNSLPSIKNLAGKKVFLVDHNDLGQAGFGIERAEICGILDHHKLDGIKTKEPIYARIEPIGSTSTLVFKLFQESKITLNKKQAILLLSGIISDTLKLTSPTTTQEDRIAIKYLATLSGIEINEFAQEIFKVRSDISGIKIKELISLDCKAYQEKNVSLWLGVYETLDPQAVLNKSNQVFSALQEIKKEERLDLIFFSLVDIIKKQSHFFLVGEKEREISQKAFKAKSKDNILFLPGVVSRKKQMVPPILEAL